MSDKHNLATSPDGSGAAALPAAAPVRHFDYLDALRGVAILGVLVVHAAELTGQQSRFSDPLFAGRTGVQLFYMVSAFTLFLSMDDRQVEHSPISNFFLRRFFRIAPLFYIAILLSWTRVHANLGNVYRPTSFEFLLGVFFLSGFKSSAINTVALGGWSVAVESTFYATLPTLHRWLRSVRGALLAYGFWTAIAVPVSMFLARRNSLETDYFLQYWFPVELPVFLLGIAIYFGWKDYLNGAHRNPRGLKVRSLVCLLVSATVLVGNNLRPIGTTAERLLVDTLAVACFFVAITLHQWAALVNPATRFLGKISFSMYLLHFYVFEFMSMIEVHVAKSRPHTVFGLKEGRILTFLVYLLVLLAGTIPVAMLSWKVIEQPGIRLGRRIIARREKRRFDALANRMPKLTSPMDTTDAQF